MGRAGIDGPLLPQAHIYSLGATLKAALEYVAEPELEPRLSPDLEALLSQMQAEDPRDRPNLEVSAQPGTGATLELRHGHLRRAASSLRPASPGAHACPQSIIALCEEKVQPVSSCRLCRSLSAAGRRVLSIESFGAFQGKDVHPHTHLPAHVHTMRAHTWGSVPTQ